MENRLVKDRFACSQMLASRRQTIDPHSPLSKKMCRIRSSSSPFITMVKSTDLGQFYDSA